MQLVLLPLLQACTEPADVAPDNGWVLVASDEFDGAAGSAPDASKWRYDIGGDGWGNDQLEHNTDRTDNAFLDGDGHLVIRALAEDYEGNAYTSARMKTQGTFEQAYGRFEARIRLPEGDGLWPAFWLLGADIDEVGWPTCGEIDIMEYVGSDPNTVFGTLHGPGYSGGDGVGNDYSLTSGSFADDFHVFAVEWDPGLIAWSVDGIQYGAVGAGHVGGPWVFDDPFFLILNLAVGGTLGGPVDPDIFPADMVVDYVRIYERAEPLSEDSGS